MTALTTVRSQVATEPQARLDALLTVMSTLQDTELLYTAGARGAAPRPGGSARGPGSGRYGDGGRRGGTERPLDTGLTERTWTPRGSGALLAGALFLDARPGAELSP
ncbi:triphosphoribosyl-dephospho-CoA synthase [Streptomyces qaidamensis]|uniref:triphosphoribosyl-dephospho-CoA synthase n=1 Tax=Streptomyces qaidamensis TaxID=1783515 RepID=UPI000D18696A